MYLLHIIIVVRTYKRSQLIQAMESLYLGSGGPELHGSELQIECTATEATVTFTYRGSDYYTSIVSYAVAWICEVHVHSFWITR